MLICLPNLIKRMHPRKGEKKKECWRTKVQASKQPKRGMPHREKGTTKYQNLHKSLVNLLLIGRVLVWVRIEQPMSDHLKVGFAHPFAHPWNDGRYYTFSRVRTISWLHKQLPFSFSVYFEGSSPSKRTLGHYVKGAPAIVYVLTFPWKYFFFMK